VESTAVKICVKGLVKRGVFFATKLIFGDIKNNLLSGNQTTQSLLKAVCNVLIQLYLIYALIIWGRASQTVIQPLVILRTKLWNFTKYPTKSLWMKCIWKITY